MERICRLHDIYMVSIQQAMYKAVGPDVYPPFGKFATRRAALDELVKQLVTLEEYAAESDGPYLCGSEPTAADCAVFPTACFWMRMLPLFGFQGFMGPALSKWWEHMTSADDVGQKVYGEVDGALAGWEARGRWDAIRGAGLRDEAAPTIFDKILAREIPSDIVYEDDHVLAFRDIAPVAPTHVLVIPKVREGLTQLQHASAEHKFVLGHMLGVAVPAVVKAEGLDSYRLVVNDGAEACQSVFHLHMHVIGGQRLSWPPGVPGVP
jgi:diadenosine tetraphosphate (Ap4A) HIT family hydrolase